jgi:hypothetical protein
VIVLLSPTRDQDFGFFQGEKDLPIHTPARAVNNPNALEITKRWLRQLREFGR